jgi:tRNA pseudouridine55 synthase
VVHDVRAAVAEDGTPVIDLDVTVECSSGTYIRALARDLGAGLGVGGHLTALRRTKVGPYSVESARTLEQLEEKLEVLPIAEAAGAAFPRWDIDAEQAKLLSNGMRLPAPGLGADGPVAVFGPDGTFLALIEESGGKAKPVAVFVG